MKEGAVKFPEITSRKNSSITSNQQQFAVMIQMQQQQAQVYQNSGINSKASNVTDQKDQMNTSATTAFDPKYDQAQVYQWEESQKKRQSNIHNISYIKNYHDSEPERPKQLFVQRSQIDGKMGTGDTLNQYKGEGNHQGTIDAKNGQKSEYNHKFSQKQGQALRNDNSLSNIEDQFKGDNQDDIDQENQYKGRITHSNIQINYKNVQPHPLQTINKNQEERQKVAEIQNGKQQQYGEKELRQKQNINGNQPEQGTQKQGQQYNQNNNPQYQNQENDQNQDDNEDNDSGEDDDDQEEEGEDGEDEEGDDNDDDDDEDDEDFDDDEDREYPFLVLKDIINMKRNIKQQKRIIIDLAFTRYDVIRDVCEEVYNWQIQANANNRTDYNIQWIDSYVHEDDFRRMLPFQKINHFPGSQQLGKKNLLGQNLLKMRNVFPNNYNFYPITWVLPLQYEDLRMFHYQNLKRKPYYIVKPEASCQGRGIYLTSRIDQLQNTEHYVVQEYIKNPFLIDNLKFDLRLYVLIKSISPLKIFLFQDGLARFATVPYKPPNKNNVSNLMMHLTNYALNKKSPDFVQNEDSDDDDIGHKRSFSSILKHLYNQGQDVETLMMEIRQIIVKTIISAQPQMSHMYRTCQPKNEQNEMCFEVLGFDIMLDEDLKPYLIEVNHTPSFWTDSPLDLQVKKNLIIDTLNIINVTSQTKKKYYDMRVQQQIASRSLFRKKYGPALNTGQEEFDEELIQQEFYEWEEENMGAYMRIYPANDDPLNYSQFLQASGSTVQDSLSRKKRLSNNPDMPSSVNLSSNLQQQQIQQQFNGQQANQGGFNNNPYNNYPHHQQQYQQQAIVSQRNQQEQQFNSDQNYQMMVNDSSPQKPMKIKLVQTLQKSNGYANGNQGMSNNFPTDNSNFTPLHVQQQQPQQQNLAFQQLQYQQQNVNQNVYLPNGNYPNNQYKNLQALPQGQTATPGKIRASIKGNTLNAGIQQQNVLNYQITGSGFQSQSAKKSYNTKLGDTQPQQNPFQQQPMGYQHQQYVYLDEMEGVTQFTYAEPTKPIMMNMDSPSQVMKVKRGDNNPNIFQQKSLVFNQPPKNINGLKLIPVEQMRNNNNSMNQGQAQRGQEPGKNRITSSQSFHQSNVNHTLNSTNQSSSNNNNNNSMNLASSDKSNNDLEKHRKTLSNNVSVLDNSQINQMVISGKATTQIPPVIVKNQNCNTYFQREPQTQSSKEEENDDYQYKKSLKTAQQIQQQSQKSQHKSNTEHKHLNSSFNGNDANLSNTGQHHPRAISLVSDKTTTSQIQKQLKEDIYPHNINQNLKRLNSSLQNQNVDEKSPIGPHLGQGKIEENIYFPFGSPQTQVGNNKIRNKSVVNPVMVAAYSNNNNNNNNNQGNNSYIKSHSNHNPSAQNAPIILPNVIQNQNNNNNSSINNNNFKKGEGVNNVIIPKQIEEHDIKLPKQKARNE